MKRAALGLRMHSGWGVLVAVAGDATSVELMDRRRIVDHGSESPRGQPTLSLCSQPRTFGVGTLPRELCRGFGAFGFGGGRGRGPGIGLAPAITSSVPPSSWHRVDRCRLWRTFSPRTR